MRGTSFRLANLLVLTILLLATAIQAGTVEENLFGAANEAYSRGNYDQAIEKYERITATAGYAPGVLFNLANSYAMSGKPGRAILNYERALRVSPSDPDIAGNLELIKKENGLFPQEPSITEQFFRTLSLNQWTMLILLALFLGISYLLAAMKYRLTRQLAIGAVTCCILLLALGGTGTLVRYQDFNPAVVITPDVKMLVSPFPSSASIGTLPEGRLVFPQKSHGSFSYVADELGRQGWIDSSHLESVCKAADGDS